MTDLKRIKSGCFDINSAIKLTDDMSFEEIKNSLISPLNILDFNRKNLSQLELEKISHGQSLITNEYEHDELILLNYGEKLCAVAQKDSIQNKLIIKKVLI